MGNLKLAFFKVLNMPIYFGSALLPKYDINALEEKDLKAYQWKKLYEGLIKELNNELDNKVTYEQVLKAWKLSTKLEHSSYFLSKLTNNLNKIIDEDNRRESGELSQ